MKTAETVKKGGKENVHSTSFNPESQIAFFGAAGSGFFSGLPIQAKLRVGAPDDRYEVEADAMADRVMRMPDPLVQRKCSSCEDKEKLHRKPLADAISPLVQRSSEGVGAVSSNTESSITGSVGSGSALPDATRSFMETRFGTDFSGVNIHTGSRAQQLNTRLGARAFTYGNDIFFNRGEYNPSSREGKHLLAHELTHVVQQKRKNKDSVDYRLQKKPEKEESCPNRKKGEVERHQTSNFKMEFVTTKSGNISRGVEIIVPFEVFWLIYDFGIGEASISKANFPKDLFVSLSNQIKEVYAYGNWFYKFSVTGFSDCSGSSEINSSLRKGRAESTGYFLNNLLVSIGGWPNDIIKISFNTNNGKFITDESTEKNRSYNRSAIIIGELYSIKPEPTPKEEIDVKGTEKLGRFVKEIKEKLGNKNDPRSQRLFCILDKLYDLRWNPNQGWEAVPKKGIKQDYVNRSAVYSYFNTDWGEKNNARENLREIYKEDTIHEYLLKQAYWDLNSDSFMHTLESIDITIIDGNYIAGRRYSHSVITPGHNSREHVMREWIVKRQKNKMHFYSCYDQGKDSFDSGYSKPKVDEEQGISNLS